MNMNTLILDRISPSQNKIATPNKNNASNKFMDFADGQSKNRTGWFLFSLVFQGVLFLPIPAALMFYYSAPIYVLAITLTLFFANIIAGMGGSSIRVLIGLFASSILIHVLMMLVFMI
jgi:hypothetical protein